VDLAFTVQLGRDAATVRVALVLFSLKFGSGWLVVHEEVVQGVSAYIPCGELQVLPSGHDLASVHSHPRSRLHFSFQSNLV
jgi:hypothetical protein